MSNEITPRLDLPFQSSKSSLKPIDRISTPIASLSYEWCNGDEACGLIEMYATARPKQSFTCDSTIQLGIPNSGEEDLAVTLRLADDSAEVVVVVKSWRWARRGRLALARTLAPNGLLCLLPSKQRRFIRPPYCYRAHRNSIQRHIFRQNGALSSTAPHLSTILESLFHPALLSSYL